MRNQHVQEAYNLITQEKPKLYLSSLPAATAHRKFEEDDGGTSERWRRRGNREGRRV